MKFKTDENLPEEIAYLLREASYDAMSVREQQFGGEDDSIIAKVCLSENRILVTLDDDFSDIRTYPPKNYPGFIVLRVHKQDKFTIINAFKKILPLIQKEFVEHLLWIVEPHRIRVRGEE
ncbi:MAG: hypothetical protein FJ218_09780 [Ignavibacteria bacterium]|nr:hypothetical protein [Ignavibacteria bacterium]